MRPSVDSPYSVPYDLSNCASEPISFISTVQAHSCILACRESDWEVLQVSENSQTHLGHPAADLTGQGLHKFLPDDAFASILMATTRGGEYMAANPVRIRLPLDGRVNWLNCLIYRQEGQYILEFEPFDEDTVNYAMQRSISEAIQRIQQCESLQSVLQASAEEVKRITGYDRVMIYRFDEDGHGTVLSEAKELQLEAFLGLRFPASDVPAQARALFMKNPARIITDVLATPALLQPYLSPLTGQPLDQTHCAGRGVSPIHLEYLNNMGVRASMSIAITSEGKLWGLIACHHYSPKLTGHFKRHTAWFMGQLISTHIGMQTVMAYRQSVMQASLVKSKLFEQMAANWDLYEGLTATDTNMLDLVHCGGAAIYHESRITLLGNTPTKEQLLGLLYWMDRQVVMLVYHTHELAKYYPPANEFKQVAAGVLAVRLSNVPGDYLLWFRPEVTQTVHWAGNSEKAVTMQDGQVRLSPRQSFEIWSQLESGTSQPWQPYEVETAMALRNDVKDFIFQKYREVQQTNRDLTEAYDDLETFSYSVSHDLRAPLRTIEAYADILKEDHHLALGEEGLDLLNSIKTSASRLGELIAGLLAYTRAGRKSLILNMLSLQEVIDNEAKHLLEDAWRNGRDVKLKIQDMLPHVVADKPALSIVINNLLSNAIKYSVNANPAIIEVGGELTNGNVRFFVRDNGIGFDMQHAGRIFGVFNRLVNEEQFEGTGIGLAIVKRIVEKHGGSISVESAPGKGAMFYVSLPNAMV